MALFLVAIYYLGILPDGQPLKEWFPPQKIVAVAINMALGVGSFYLGILIHELGHALAGKTAGIEIIKVQIGFGREIMKLHLLGTELVFHARLAGGLTYPGKSPGGRFRPRLFAMIAGGMMANALAVGAGIWAMNSAWSETLEGIGIYLPHVFTGVNLFMIGVSLFPFTSLALGTPYPSDGRQLLRIPFMDDVDLEDFMAAAYLNRGVDLLWKDDYAGAESAFREGLVPFPRSRMLMNNLASALISQGKCAEAREILEAALGNGPPPALTGAMLRLNLAAVWLFDGSAEGIEKALEYSEAASKSLVGMHEAMVMRGAALMESGKTDEAMAILEKQVHSDKPLDKLRNSATGFIYLAYGRHLGGETEKAAELMEKLKTSPEPLSPYDQTLLERVEGRMGGI